MWGSGKAGTLLPRIAALPLCSKIPRGAGPPPPPPRRCALPGLSPSSPPLWWQPGASHQRTPPPGGQSRYPPFCSPPRHHWFSSRRQTGEHTRFQSDNISYQLLMLVLLTIGLLGGLLLVPCMYMKQNILQEGERISWVFNRRKFNFQYFKEVTVWCSPACPYLNRSIGDTRKTLHRNLAVQP